MKLTKIQLKKLDSLKWRVFNTFKTVYLPVFAGVLLLKLQDTPEKIDILLSAELWESVIYAGLITLLGSLMAGGDKVRRIPSNT